MGMEETRLYEAFKKRTAQTSQQETNNRESVIAVAIFEEHPEYTLDQIIEEIRQRLPHKLSINWTKLGLVNMLSGQFVVQNIWMKSGITTIHSACVKECVIEFVEWIMQEGTPEHIVYR